MKRFLNLLILLIVFMFSGVIYATDVNIEKANIFLKPEDTHPNGVNMEIGTASFWFEVGAEVSGESGETVSFQWYESKTGNMDDIVALEKETKEIFIPEQKIGTTYYCVGVTTSLGEESTTEYTKLLEATFTPKIIDKIWITNVVEPSIGEKPSMSAEQYTDYELNNYYGYEINSVKWVPDDETFKEGVEYRVDIDIEFWDNVNYTDKVDVKINNMQADFKKSDSQDSATVSYTFEKLSLQNESEQIEKVDEQESGEKNFDVENIADENNNEGETLDLSAIMLTTMFVVVIIFALMSMIKKK